MKSSALESGGGRPPPTDTSKWRLPPSGARVQTAAGARAFKARAAATKRAARVAVDMGISPDVAAEVSRDVEESEYCCVSCGTMEAAAFSNRMTHKRGRHGERVRRCIACTEAAALVEQQQATTKSDGVLQNPGASGEQRCTVCGLHGPACFFSRNQLSKGAAARCQKCVRADALTSTVI